MNTHLFIRRFIGLCSCLLLPCQSCLFINQYFVQRMYLFAYLFIVYEADSDSYLF